MNGELQIIGARGLLAEARHVPSPNCDPRPVGVLPELIVIHGISLPPGEYGGPWIDRLFVNALDADADPYFEEIADLRVSAHVLIRRDGSLTQYVPFAERAWHAGQSCYDGRAACNDFSIGIELEGCDEACYEDSQYLTLATLIGALCSRYPSLSAEKVVGHCDIAPGRKTDPGPKFDWSRLAALCGAAGRRPGP